jgi:hypothetical protein
MATRTHTIAPIENPALAVEQGSSSSAATDAVRAWEEIEVGRYMPRRIRGSFPGRELG